MSAAFRARLVALILAGLTFAAPAMAQRTDSTRAAAIVPRSSQAADTTQGFRRPPLSPRRAFLYSVLIPGYSQWILGRPTAGAIFVTAEAVTLTMVRESRSNLRDARRFRGDTVIVRYVDASGNPAVLREPPQANNDLVRVRRSQVEDWIAALLATHLFSGLDAYVAAHLWDVPAQVSVRPAPGGASVAARLSF